MMRRCRRLGALVLVLLITAGCWSAREINQLAIVLSFAIDRDEEGQYIVSAMVGNPANPAAPGSGGTGGGNQTGAWVLSARGETVFDAVRNLSPSVPRRLFWSHAETVIISRRLAEQGIEGVVDVLTRDIEPRRSIHPLVAEGDIEMVLRAQPILEQGVSRLLDGLLENQRQHNLSHGHDLNHYLREHATGRRASLFVLLKEEPDPKGGFGMAPPTRMAFSGSAVFWQDRMVGTLNELEARGARWILGELEGGLTNIPCPGDPDRPITVQLMPGGGDLRAGLRGGQPWGSVTLKGEGRIGEVHCHNLAMTPETMDRLSRLWEARVKEFARAALDKTQKELGVDPFGFGDAIFRSDPQGWQQLAGRWPEAYRTMPITVTAEVRLQGTGLTEGTRPAPRR